jgi:hypothetical protein
MEKQEKVFADGFIFKRSDNAPDWVVGSMSVKIDEAISFLQLNQKNGWVNLKINSAKSGKYYIELDTWEKVKKIYVEGFTEHDRFVGNDYHGKVSAPVREINPMSMAIDNERHMQEVRNSKSDLPF